MKLFLTLVLCPLVGFSLLWPSHTVRKPRNRPLTFSNRIPVLVGATASSPSPPSSPISDEWQDQQDESKVLSKGYSFVSGTSDEFTVVKQFCVPDDIEWQSFLQSMPSVSKEKLQKWKVDTQSISLNLTPPIALLIWDAETFPSLSRARKACRQQTIVISPRGDTQENNSEFRIGKVGDRVVSGDIIGIQKRLAPGQYNDCIGVRSRPTFELPVVYQDDWMAIVDKPAGVLVYQEGGGGRNTVKFALPYVLQPCQLQESIDDALPRPDIVHRLDKPTSGLLVVAKTKSAVTNLCQQFERRVVQKTYHAIVHGIPTDDDDILTRSQVVEFLGKDIVDRIGCEGWHLAANEMDGKQAITLWRILQTSPSLNGKLSLIELMPKTGRYHQLRRQLAWMYKTPIVGDSVYATDFGRDKHFHRGLMLCASSITLIHPRSGMSDMGICDGTVTSSKNLDRDGYFSYLYASNGTDIHLSASLPLPFKFRKYLQLQEIRATHSTQASEE